MMVNSAKNTQSATWNSYGDVMWTEMIDICLNRRLSRQVVTRHSSYFLPHGHKITYNILKQQQAHDHIQ